MNSTLAMPIFAGIAPELRQQISAVFVFGECGDKLLLFTNPTPPPAPPPTPVSKPASPPQTPSREPVAQTNNQQTHQLEISDSNFTQTATSQQIGDYFGSNEPEAYSFGKNIACCLATGDLVLHVDSPRKIDALCGRKFVDVVAGEGLHVVALTDDGHVLAWGENGAGQVGNGAFDECVAAPSLVFEPDAFSLGQSVVQVAVGANHSVCLTNTGKVYAWGANEFGQIGDGTKVNKPTPVHIEGAIENCNIIQVACCQRTTVALDEKGHVFQWGNNWNDNGLVGLGQPVTRPQDINATYPSFQNVRVTRVACGFNHILALAESCAVYAWGRNDCGQLGLGSIGGAREAPVLQPTKISDFSSLRVRIRKVFAHNQMNVSLATTYSGVVFVWGRQSSSGSISSRPVATTFKTIEAAFASSCQHPITAGLQKINQEQYGTATLGAPNWLRQMFDQRQSSDLEIVVNGRPIFVHRTVLKMSSPHFRAMLESENWKESKAPSIKIEKVPYTAYRAYLFYLYADELVLPPDVTQEEVVSLLDLASSYLEDDLKLKVVDYFAARWLDIENAAAIYTLAVDHMLNELASVAMEFIFENLTAVVTSHSFNQIESNHAKNIFVKAANRRLFSI